MAAPGASPTREKAAVGAVTRGANRVRIDAALAAISSSTRPPECQVAAENPQARILAKRVKEAAEEAARLDAEIAALLAEDGARACLLTVPGIGPGTASELVISIDIGDFLDHDHLASYCGIAPRNRQSGKSVSSASSSRQGSERLKNLLIFSCNSLCRSKCRFGDYYRSCRGRGMRHGEALKAVARKRLKAIYAIIVFSQARFSVLSIGFFRVPAHNFFGFRHGRAAVSTFPTFPA